jgi:hypothetical protein
MKKEARDRDSCEEDNSFLPGTAVLLADGTSRPIEKLARGDLVIAADPLTGVTTAKPVTATIARTGAKKLVDITIDTDGDRGDETASVTATHNHPFWVPAFAAWVDAEHLSPRQWLRTGSGTLVQITAVRHHAADTQVHNLTVADLHTYHVLAGATPVLVHNCGETLYRSPQRGNRASERRGLNPANHTERDHLGKSYAYLGDSESVVQQYAGKGVYEDGYHVFYMKDGFTNDFHPSVYRKFHDKDGGLQWVIEVEEFEDFNSYLDHSKTKWVPWRRGMEFDRPSAD